MKNKCAGFTLTEMLLVTTMLAVISLAVFNAFSNGLKLWARGQHVTAEGDTAIFLDRFAEDLRQTAIISSIVFKGESQEISIPAVIYAPMDTNSSRKDEVFADTLGAVRYVYDPVEKKIFRSQAIYGQALKGQWTKPIAVAVLIEDMSLHYYFNAEHGMDIKSSTQDIPKAVMLDVSYQLEGQMYHMHRFIPIPVGGGL